MLASTHGVQVYHPAPDDLWRWTHAGLERLFRDNADWSAVRVEPGAGTAACVGMLLGTFMHLLAKRLGAPAAREAGDRRPERRRGGARPARALAARAAAGRDLRQLPRRRGGGLMARKVLVTGGGGFIGSNLVRGAARARRRRPRARQLRHRQPHEPRRRRGRRGGRRGRAPLLRARPQRRPRGRGRLPPRCARLRPTLGAGPADDERRQRRGDAERPARGARRGGPARRVRLVVVRLRLGDRAAGTRGRAGRPDLALRRREAGGRALLRLVQPRLPLVRDGRAALLQRLRAAPEPALAVRGRRAAVPHRDRARASR